MKASSCVARSSFLLVIFCSITGNAQILETGSLRSFILGTEPAASYDNWNSHTVEGLSEPGGYNHHIPPELDPQTNGFGSFEFILGADAPANRLLWRSVLTHIWSDNPTEAQALFDQASLPYEVVYFEDTETGNTFRMLREVLNVTYVDTGFYAGPEDDVIGSFDKGWGLFIFNPEASVPWAHAQVAHVSDDFVCVPMVTDFFLDGNLGGLALNGTGREVFWQPGEDYNNGRSLSDPSRNGNLPFQWFTEFFVDTLRAQGEVDITIQFHSYDSESHANEPTIQISCGSRDGYPNRPARDISGLGYDWINFAPTVVVPADYSMPGQLEVTVENYFAVWRGNGLYHLESGIEMPRNVELSGYGDSPQMAVAAQGVNRFEARDRWLHVEFDELPNPVAAAEHTELDFFAGTIPPTESNWDAMLRYYEASTDALVAYLNDVENPQDTDPPSTPADLRVFYAADNFVELEWDTPSLDPNFSTYQVYYGTDEEIDTTNAVWTFENDGDLVGQNIRFTRVTGLEFNLDYGFRLRGTDEFGQSSELTPISRAITSEGDQFPLPFSLLTPLDADTCFTLDTTLTWEATTDADLYDTPHYDVWIDTLLDFSTAWIPEDADSIAETSFDLVNLINRRTYYWTVRATDRNTAGTWANETNSLITYHPLPPAPFELAFPVDRETVWDTTSTTLRWNSTYSQDDPEFQVDYIAIIAESADFSVNSDTTHTEDTSWTVDNLLMDQTYWWKVFAYDVIDTIRCDDVWKFFAAERQIPNFSLVAPEDGEWIDNDTVLVSWSIPEEIELTPRSGSTQSNFGLADQLKLEELSSLMSRAGKGSSLGSGQGWSTIDTQGGPDTFGHVWIDNKEPGGPLYDWIEISDTGTLSTVSGVDDATQVVALPFAFSYYGDDYATVVISSNGNIHFGNPDNGYNHYTIPSPDGPAGIIAPWWIDLRPNVQGDIYYYGSEEYFIVQYDNCREYGHENWLYTFEVILYPDGRIKFQYESMRGGLADATIGIENLAEDDGLLVAFNAAYVADRIAIQFTFEDWLYNVQWSADPAFEQPLSLLTFDNEYSISEVALRSLFPLDELDELPDDLTVFWRVETTNLFGQSAWALPGESGRNFMVYIQEPPSSFELLSPSDGVIVETDTVTVSWLPATDPDPLDTLTYLVEWSDNEELFEPQNQAVVADTFFSITDLQFLLEQYLPPEEPTPEVQRIQRKKSRDSRSAIASSKTPLKMASSTADPSVSNELDELPDNTTIYWRVRAQDQASNQTWPMHGETPWSFLVQVPEPPSEFILLLPVNDDTLTIEEISQLVMDWEDSIDPDPGEEVVYSASMHIDIGELLDTTLSVNGLETSEFTVNLLDILELTEWEEMWNVTWAVNAISNSDTTSCEEGFIFFVEPFLSVIEQPFTGIPTEYSIASIYPNPFNPTATVVVGLPDPGNLSVVIYNVMGQQVRTFTFDQADAGYHSIPVDGRTLASGVYFVRATVPGKLEVVRKIVLVR
jgi:Secretion system C-terminal sorting domain